MNAKLRPFRTSGLANRLTVNVGAEFGAIERSYSDYQVQNPPGFLDQDRTSFATYFAGTSMRWHPRFDTRLRYEHRNASNPLYGVNDYSGLTNTNQPTCEDVVRLDATWLAADNLMATANVALENRQNHTGVANFDRGRLSHDVYVLVRAQSRLVHFRRLWLLHQLDRSGHLLSQRHAGRGRTGSPAMELRRPRPGPEFRR